MCLTRQLCFSSVHSRRQLLLTYPPSPLLLTLNTHENVPSTAPDQDTFCSNVLIPSSKHPEEHFATSSCTTNDCGYDGEEATDDSITDESNPLKNDITNIHETSSCPSQATDLPIEANPSIEWLELADAANVSRPRDFTSLNALDLANFDLFCESYGLLPDDDTLDEFSDTEQSSDAESEAAQEQPQDAANSDFQSLARSTFDFPDEEEELEQIIREERQRLANSTFTSTHIQEPSNQNLGNASFVDLESAGSNPQTTEEDYQGDTEEDYQGDTEEDALTEHMAEEKMEAYLSAPTWAPYENTSLFPESTATSPEVCKWASYHEEDYLYLQEEVWHGDLSNDALRRYSLQRWAWTHIYPLSNWQTYLLPYRSFGYKRSPTMWYQGADGRGVVWEYPRGCKGRRPLSDPNLELEFYRPAGVRAYHQTEHDASYSRNLFIPRPSKLSQATNSGDSHSVTLDELSHEEHAE